MRHGKETQEQVTDLVVAMQRARVPAFMPDRLGVTEREKLGDLVNLAKRHHSIQEQWCSQEMTDELRARTEGRQAGLEHMIRELAKEFGLAVHFDGDPRGFTVKLHAPGGSVYNTWGGKESGYGIGGSGL